jgi:hypothetical protein
MYAFVYLLDLHVYVCVLEHCVHEHVSVLDRV